MDQGKASRTLALWGKSSVPPSEVGASHASAQNCLVSVGAKESSPGTRKSVKFASFSGNSRLRKCPEIKCFHRRTPYRCCNPLEGCGICADKLAGQQV